MRIVALLGPLALAGCSVFGGQAAPEPEYDLVREDGAIEIRAYPELIVAKTTVAADSRDRAVGRGFNRLFDYISGANRAAEEIAMTAPVVIDDETEGGEEIPMTAPVVVDGPSAEEAEDGQGRWTTMFILPEGTSLDTAPRPTEEAVSLDTIPARQVAVIRFSGFLDDKSVAEQRRALDDWLERQGIAHTGAWRSAGYNPPWTLPWLRRNEVMVPLAAEATSG
ncbi:MAG: heme-binding protein [Paracoccaceae bacterium]